PPAISPFRHIERNTHERPLHLVSQRRAPRAQNPNNRRQPTNQFENDRINLQRHGLLPPCPRSSRTPLSSAGARRPAQGSRALSRPRAPRGPGLEPAEHAGTLKSPETSPPPALPSSHIAPFPAAREHRSLAPHPFPLTPLSASASAPAPPSAPCP